MTAAVNSLLVLFRLVLESTKRDCRKEKTRFVNVLEKEMVVVRIVVQEKGRKEGWCWLLVLRVG